jgi:hypothetical protein
MIKADLEINQFNLKEAALQVPSKKHFWVARLIDHKRHLKALEKGIDVKKQKIANQIKADGQVAVSYATALQASEKHDEVKKLRQDIDDEKIVIEYLEKVERVFSQLGFDVTNIIKIIAMEQL